jgi:hypothetical protein
LIFSDPPPEFPFKCSHFRDGHCSIADVLAFNIAYRVLHFHHGNFLSNEVFAVSDYVRYDAQFVRIYGTGWVRRSAFSNTQVTSLRGERLCQEGGLSAVRRVRDTTAHAKKGDTTAPPEKHQN